MYKLWVRRLKRLYKNVKLWMRLEKENEESEIYLDLIELRDCVGPVLRLGNRVLRQQFIRFTEKEELFEKMEVVVKRFKCPRNQVFNSTRKPFCCSVF